MPALRSLEILIVTLAAFCLLLSAVVVALAVRVARVSRLTSAIGNNGDVGLAAKPRARPAGSPQGRSGRSIDLPAFRGRAGGAGAGTRLGANQVSRAIETPQRGPMIFRDRQGAGGRLGDARPARPAQ